GPSQDRGWGGGWDKAPRGQEEEVWISAVRTVHDQRRQRPVGGGLQESLVSTSDSDYGGGKSGEGQALHMQAPVGKDARRRIQAKCAPRGPSALVHRLPLAQPRAATRVFRRRNTRAAPITPRRQSRLQNEASFKFQNEASFK